MNKESDCGMKEKKLKPISDIRLYRSNIPNIDGNSLPSEFAPKQLNIIVTRIVMKLKEKGFSLVDYDHLYINFTTCLPNGEIAPSKRSIDAYHKWYRYYDVGVSVECYRNLESKSSVEFVIEQIKNVLNAYFCTETNCSVKTCIEEALNKGEDMLMLYKSKQTSKRKADIYLQLLDNGMYCPNLIVYDQNGVELLHQKLPCTLDLMSLGEIQLSNKKVVVKPRKNSLASQLEPLEFELNKNE